MPLWNILEGFHADFRRVCLIIRGSWVIQRSLHRHVVLSVLHITQKRTSEAFVFTLYIWRLPCLKSCLCKASVMSQGEVAKQTFRKKPTCKKERKENKISARLGGGKMKRAAFCKCIKRIIFSLQPSTIIHHQCPRTLILLRPLTPNLIIDKTIQINYLLGLLFIDKSFGKMISNNHKWMPIDLLPWDAVTAAGMTLSK